MAASTYQGLGTRSSFGTGVTSVTPAITTTNITPGDIVFIEVATRNNEVHVGSDPAWTKLFQSNSTAQWTDSLWAIIVPDNGYVPELTVSWNTSNNGGFAQSFSFQREPNGDTLAEAMNITTAAGSSGTFFIAGRQTTQANSLGVVIGSCQGTGTFTPPTGWTERVDNGSSTGTSRNFVNTKAAPTAGTTLEDYTLTRTGAYVLYMVEILEAIYDNAPLSVVNSGDGYMDASNVVNTASNPLLGGNGNRLLFRFGSVNVPAGSYLKRARLRVALSAVTTAYQDFGYIWGDKVANAPAWATEAPNLSRLTSSSTPIYFEVQSPASTLAAGNAIFLDVTPQLKEIRRLPGWVEGNPVRFVQDYGTSAAAISLSASEGGGTSVPQLILDFGTITNTVSFTAGSGGSFEGWWDPYTSNQISDPNIAGMDILRVGTSNSGVVDLVVYGDQQTKLTGSTLTVNGQTYSLLGQSYDGTTTSASYNRSGAAEWVVGQPYTVTLNLAGGSNNLSLSAATGAFTRTGNPANLQHGWSLAAAGRAFALASPATDLRKGYPFPLAPAVFSYDPRAANLMRTRRLAADQRAFTLTGINAVTAASRRLVANSSSFSYTPRAASLLHGFTLSAASGAIALSSAATGFRRNRALAANPAAYALASPAVALPRSRRIAANPAAYVLASAPASFRRTGGLIAAPAAYVLASPAAFIRRGFQLPAQPGAFNQANPSVTFGQSRRLPAAPTTYGAVFRDAILLRSRALQANSATYAALSPDTRLGQFFRKVAATGSFLLNPTEALLALKRQLLADAAAFDLTGAADLRLSGPVTTTPPSARIYTPFFENRIIVFPASGPRVATPSAEDRIIVFPTENRIMLASGQLFTDRVIAP